MNNLREKTPLKRTQFLQRESSPRSGMVPNGRTLVIRATGIVDRQALSQLSVAGAQVRALTCKPDTNWTGLNPGGNRKRVSAC